MDMYRTIQENLRRTLMQSARVRRQ